MTQVANNPLGPAWRGNESYRQFAESVKTNLRYVRSKGANDFLDEVFASSGNRKQTISQGDIFWRARLGCEYEMVTHEGDDIDVSWPRPCPYGQEAMKPISNWQNEGRANPRGIPCLYLATTRDTALAEVRPWIGAMISVARLKIRRDLNVIDCSKYHSMDAFKTVILDHTRPREDGIWMAIDRAFATPVSRDDESKEYLPTQILAELFKSEGFDGLVYKSLLTEDGFNLALFNLEDADVAHCEIFKAASIKFHFESEGFMYFRNDEGYTEK
ncbi:RES family NAD+ phosphorylase [Methylocystis sp.]|uniref:RES family NAD+ phosphorylase n=1 Tax=Methylocystis sp. TaxID=1911079 RepID=UPI003D14596E